MSVSVGWDTSNLAVLVDSAGNICTSCCVPPGGPGTGEDCEYCTTNTTPLKATITLGSGGSSSQCCLFGAHYIKSYIDTAGDYVLTQNANPLFACFWSARTYKDFGWWKWYDLPDCSDSVESDEDIHYSDMTIRRYADKTLLRVNLGSTGGRSIVLINEYLSEAYHIPDTCIGFDLHSVTGNTCMLTDIPVAIAEGDTT